MYRNGAVAGVIADTVMSMAMMTIAILRGDSVWALPNLIAAMWFGPGAGTGTLGLPTIAGFATHEATSALMGAIAVPIVDGLPGGRLFVVSLAYALASYPLVFSLVLSWANPTMYTHAPMMQMTWGHLIFGAVFAMAYLRLTRGRTGSA